MHSSKFIQIRKDRSVEQRLASIWLDACSELEIPCILIYQGHRNAYISVNLKFIPETLAQNLDPEKLKEQLSLINQKYTSQPAGYCQHNPGYHTFDGVPKEVAQELATEVFDSISAYNIPALAETQLEEQNITA